MRVLLAIAVLAPVLAGAADPPPREKYAVDWFAEGCLRNLSGPHQVEKWAQSRQLPPLSSDVAAGFLAGASGKGWSATNASGEYVVVSRSDGICTLFARVATSATAKPYFFEILEYMLPSSRFEKESKTKTVKAAKGDLETTHLRIRSKKTGALLHVVFSGTASTQGNYQVAMSSRLCEAVESAGAHVPPELRCGGSK